MHYRANMIDVKVDDTDRCLLIDVINDFYEKAAKESVVLPKFPTFAYSYKMKSWYLNNDKDLMEMFSRKEGNEVIDIWIGCGDALTQVWLLAKNLRESNKNNASDDLINNVDNVIGVRVRVAEVEVEVDNATNHRQKLPIKRNVSTLKPYSPDNSPLKKSPVKTKKVTMGLSTPRRSARLNETIQSSPPPTLTQPHSSSPSISLLDNDDPIVIVQPPPISPSPSLVISPRRSLRLSGSSPPQVNVIVQSNTEFHPNTQVEPSLSKFKIARTTAIRKGSYIPKVQLSTDVREEFCGRVTRGIKLRLIDSESEEENSDGSYVPSDVEGYDDNGLSELEEDDNLEEEDNLDDVDDWLTVDNVDHGYSENEWSSEDEGDGGNGYSRKILRNSELYDDNEFGAIKLKPWQLFVDKDHFKEVLRDYCVQEGFFVIVLKSEWNRYTATCATVDCDWRIHASVLPDGITWAIKTIKNVDHGCVGVRNNNPMANCLWVARKLLEDIRANPTMNAETAQKLLMDRYGIQMAKSSVYKMRDIALTEINGGHDESYKLLPQYCEMVKLTNPQSSAICSWVIMNNPQRTLQFKSIFISFYAQFMGLIKGCRSLIGIDGTHLKGNHGGVLLSAIAIDGNNQVFPVAVGIVECEDKNTWANFLWHLKQCLRESERTDWTIISDRQKGIEPALEIVWPEAYRRFCARHLSRNFKKDYPGILMNKLFWSVVKATSEYTFKKALERVIEYGGMGVVDGLWT